MKIEVKNTYHNTIEVVEATSLEQVKRDTNEMLQITANNLTPHEIEEDWELAYENYESAYNATYDGILEQLTNEIEYRVLN